MRVAQLRAKHPVLHYRRFFVDQSPEKLLIRFDFLLEPDIRFQPELVIPMKEKVDLESLKPLVFNLGLVEAISYWKAACPPVLSVEAGDLDKDQINWWHDLFLHGLGEFFYKNKIDFTKPDFLTISGVREGMFFRSIATAPAGKSEEKGGDPDIGGTRNKYADLSTRQDDSALILVGGGKDSVVTLELTKKLGVQRQAMLLNPTPAMLAVTRLAGFSEPIIVKRTIDAALLNLNHEGYLNGHTPFSAYLAFLSLLVGKIYHFRHVLTSNEESASVGNAIFKGLEINHQYSKSFRFEERFRDYSQKYLGSTPEYLSFLRPLSELQIASLFAKFAQYFPVFNSCNVGRGKFWCGHCPKCAFVFLILSPFVPSGKLIQIFGKDLLDEPSLSETFLDLVGLNGLKPFDCVGTKEESVEAVSLTLNKYQTEDRKLPQNLALLKEKLNIKEPLKAESVLTGLKSRWNNNHFLPKEYAEVIKKNYEISGN